MLTDIKTARLPRQEEDAVSMLLGCHDRIRHFTSMALRLSQADAPTSAEIANAAAAVHRYFTVALPLHEADENYSVHPRLRAAAPAGELAGPAADAMVEQHGSIDELVERLVPLCEMLKAEPSLHSSVAPELHQVASALNEIFLAHLRLEEETVFPALKRYLSEDELQSIVAEMRDRRDGTSREAKL